MWMKRVSAEDFVGKTIKAVDAKAVNYLLIEFTDGTKVELETGYAGYGIYGIFQHDTTPDGVSRESTNQ